MRLTDDHLRLSRHWAEEIARRGGPELAAAWVELDKLNTRAMPYRPLDGRTAPINASHADILHAPLGRFGLSFLIDLGIDGFLHREEALTLYELAHAARGDVLELGTHKGLSTSILARALHDRGDGRLETVDIDADANAVARDNLAGRPGGERVTFTLKDATARLDELGAEGRRFGMVFIDHWHGYDATLEAAQRVPGLLAPGAFVMFHDFFDPSNIDPEHVYGVYQGALDGLGADSPLAFIRSAGGSSVFRLRS